MNASDMRIQHEISTWLLRENQPNNIKNIEKFGATLANDIKDYKSVAIICRGTNWQNTHYIVISVADASRCQLSNKECAVTTISSFITALHRSAQSKINNPIDWMQQAIHISNDIVNAEFNNKNGSSLAELLIHPEYGFYLSNVGSTCVYSSSCNQLTKISMDDVVLNSFNNKSTIMSGNNKILQFIGMGRGLEPHVSKLYSLDFDYFVLMAGRVDFFDSYQDLLSLFFLNAISHLSCADKFIDLSLQSNNKAIAIIELPFVYDFSCESEPSLIEVWDPFGCIRIIAK